MARSMFLMIFLPLVFVLSGCALLPDNQFRTLPPAQRGPTPTSIPTPIVPSKPVYEVVPGEVVKSVELIGRVAPVLEQELFFQSNGRVRNVFVERDDVVTAGQLLADLEIDDLERELETVTLNLQQAEQALAEAEQTRLDNLSKAEINVSLAKARLVQAEQDRVDDLAQAQIALNIKLLELAKAESADPNPQQVLATSDFLTARNALQRAQEAYDAIAFSDDVGASSEAITLEQATLDFANAQAAYDLALQQLETYDFDLELLKQSVARAELDVTRLQGNNSVTELTLLVELAQLDYDILARDLNPVYANNVEQAKLEVQKLEAAISEAKIVAPFGGQILSESLSEGRDVTAYDPIVIIADPDTLEISADPTSAKLQDLEEGMPVVAFPANRPGEGFSGTIRRLPYPYGGGGRTEGVEDDSDKSTRVAMDQPLANIGFEVGDSVLVEVIVEQRQDVLWLPPQAIRTFEGRSFVLIQEGESQRRADVSLGLKSEERVEIKSGLSEGQIVIGP